MKRSEHPPSCRVCRGTGWEPAEPRHEIAGGYRIRYDTHRPCGHHWPDDDPGWETPAQHGTPRVTSILGRAIEQGRRELAAMRHEHEQEHEQQRLTLDG